MNRNIIQLLTLFTLLVILPAGSWYYLRKGLDYRLEATHELEKLGTLPEDSFQGFDGSTPSRRQFASGVVIVSRVETANKSGFNRVLQELGKVHTQFDARQDVFFVIAAPDADSAQFMQAAQQNDLDDPAQVFLIKSSSADAPDFGFSRAGFERSSALVALADTSGQIRQYYDFNDGSRVKRLVEHITMLMPVIEREQAALKRQKEM